MAIGMDAPPDALPFLTEKARALQEIRQFSGDDIVTQLLLTGAVMGYTDLREDLTPKVPEIERD